MAEFHNGQQFHKFKLGQQVELLQKAAISKKTIVLGRFEVIRLLPGERGDRQYHLRALLDRHERVASEYELRPIVVAVT